jgi:hypothetical protein
MYEPLIQESAGACPLCGKSMVKHIRKEGARYHVISWHGSKNGATSHCSEPDCEKNHGPGHCVPLDAEPVKLPKCAFRKSFPGIVPERCAHQKGPWPSASSSAIDFSVCVIALAHGECPLHKKIGDL